MKPSAPIGVVTGFVIRDRKLLVLRRSARVGTYQGLWAGVSGYIEGVSPRSQMLTELAEELGIGSGLCIIEAEGDPLRVVDSTENRMWLVHPFRVALDPGARPRLDWEHVASKWVDPDAIRGMDTVPGLWEAWCRVSEGIDD